MGEIETQKQILDYCKKLHLDFWRQNNIRIPGRTFNGLKGISDIMGFYCNKFIAIEVKYEREKLNEDQEKFKTMVERNGQYYATVYNLDDFIVFLKKIRNLEID